MTAPVPRRGHLDVARSEPEVGEREIHPLCSIFPDMAPDEYEDLKGSIKVNGLLHPIVTYEEAILDGKNRDRACRELGVEPRTESYQGDDLFGFVVAKNLTRRNLTTSQRSIIAGKIANMRQGERTDLEPSANLQKVSRTQAAEMLNVSPRTVVDATYVLDHGTPDLVSAVEQGDMKTSTAKAIADLPPEEQQRIVEEKDPGARRAAIKAAKKSSAATKQKTTKATTEPPVTKQNTLKAPANEQPAPKKFKPGSPKWVEEQVEALCEAASNLQSVYPKLTGYRQERIRQAQKALEHVVRIGANFDQVRRVSLELVQLWNQQGGTQLEDEDLKYLMRDVKEAVACVPHIRPWKQVIKKAYAAHGSHWFTREHFKWLTDAYLDEIEREWAPAAPEAAGNLAEAEPEADIRPPARLRVVASRFEEPQP